MDIQQLVTYAYYEDWVDFSTAKQLVGADAAQRFRLLKADIDAEPLDLAVPSDADIYGDGGTVETDP